jgi:hypothetical protein
MAGHYNEKTTRELMGKTFYWPKLKEDRAICPHVDKMPKYQVGTQEKV